MKQLQDKLLEIYTRMTADQSERAEHYTEDMNFIVNALLESKRKLDEAVQILHSFTILEVCAVGKELRNGQTCQQYFSNINGIPMSSCLVCQTKSLIESL